MTSTIDEPDLADYAKTVQVKPDFAEAYLRRGKAKGAKGDKDGENADRIKAIELKPALGRPQ